MKKIGVVLSIPLLIIANPIAVEIINEFQTAASGTQRIEFKYFESPATDTIFNGFSLLNMQIHTPAGTAIVDTDIWVPPLGYGWIDPSMVSGPFFLPPDTGFLATGSGQYYDSIFYPCSSFSYKELVIPAPTPGASAAKFYRWASDTGYYEYWPITDWYVDETPTFGTHNDDYSGCSVAGTVFGDSVPIEGAQVVASLPGWYLVCNPEPYATCCTTYTASDGMYSFDSLLPYYYLFTASAPGYTIQVRTSGALRSLRPLTGFDFYLYQTGIAEASEGSDLLPFLKVYPNPFTKMTTIEFRLLIRHAAWLTESRPSLRICDATGRTVKSIDHLPRALCPTHFTWDGSDDNGNPLPLGIYFIELQNNNRTVSRSKVVKTR